MNRLRLAWNGECSKGRFWIFGRLDFDRSETCRKSFGDFFGVPRGPNAGTVDTSAAAVEVNAIDHDIDILLPFIHHIVTKQDLAESRTVDLHARIAFVSLDSLCAAENLYPTAAVHHLRPHFTCAGINTDRL